MSSSLSKVERASKRLRDARLALEASIRDARSSGASLREIARASGLSVETTRRISKGSA